MKSDIGMDAPNTPASERRYDGFKGLATDVEGLVDTLWASATREFCISIISNIHHAVEVKLTLFHKMFLSLSSFLPPSFSLPHVYLHVHHLHVPLPF